MPENEKKDKVLKVNVADNIQVSDAVVTSISDITVSAVDKDNVEHESVWPDNTPSDIIATSTAADLGVEIERSYQEKFMEGVEQVKGKYLEELEISLGPLKIKIKRAPEKVIKYLKIKDAIKKAKDAKND